MNMKKIAALAIIACAVLYAFFFYSLLGSFNDIQQEYYAGETPVLVLNPSGQEPYGTVILAHGFAGDIALMRTMGAAIAQNGYKVVIFDFPGHGDSTLSMGGPEFNDTIQWVRERFSNDTPSVAGHSMGSNAALGYGLKHDVKAVIVISPFNPAVNATSPANLLWIAGSQDLDGVMKATPDALNNATGQNGSMGVTYGDISNGTARRFEYVEGANHITIIFDERTIDSTIAWLDSVYGVKRTPLPYGLPHNWALACVALAIAAYFPLSYLVYRHYRDEKYKMETKAPAAWKPLVIMIVSAAISAVLVTLINPASVTGIMVGDTVIGFLFYCGVIGLAIYMLTTKEGIFKKYPADAIMRPAALALLMSLYFVITLGLPSGLALHNVIPNIPRIFALGLFAILALPYGVLNELCFRSIAGYKSLAAGIVSRALVIVIMVAGAMLLGQGGFIFVVLPVMLPLFLLLEVLSFYAYKWSGSVLVGAFLDTIMIAWLLASVFPMGISMF